jgi:hypothetical protein
MKVVSVSVSDKLLTTYKNTVELHLSGLIWTVSHPGLQKIRIIGISLNMGYIGSLKFGCYYLQYVPASKHIDHAKFEVL